MQVSFYLLNENKAQDILGFVCQLTQKVLKQSAKPLVILSTDTPRLQQLDEALWSLDASSFIPHHLWTDAPIAAIPSDTRAAPAAYLCTALPLNYDGVVLNLDDAPIHSDGGHVTRVLELIAPDEHSVQIGRDKYKHYQQRGATLEHFRL
ncbi:DNA polymerase III subunit chi [Psychrobacter aestuarii]|uniref:DNA polymerase III subunit chi n=1 Tax=Psychrobacter aestuarii TaxID=556327 RepID=A0ABP3FU42_9GAMM|nr:DNA polymerase III subunit chi [Psychrobacter aestuarii]